MHESGRGESRTLATPLLAVVGLFGPVGESRSAIGSHRMRLSHWYLLVHDTARHPLLDSRPELDRSGRRNAQKLSASLIAAERQIEVGNEHDYAIIRAMHATSNAQGCQIDRGTLHLESETKTRYFNDVQRLNAVLPCAKGNGNRKSRIRRADT